MYMSLLSSSVSVTRYLVNGTLKTPIIETIYNDLKKNSIQEIDNDPSEKSVGWTSFKNPYLPDFEGSSFVVGSYMVFSLRIDKKSIPSKVVNKHYSMEQAKLLAQSGRSYLSRNEKKELKDRIINTLSLRIPATPNIYDIIWNAEESWLWFFSNLKTANEELETLFSKSFKLNLIRLFPYTTANLMSGLSDPDKDILSKLSPTNFTE